MYSTEMRAGQTKSKTHHYKTEQVNATALQLL